MEDKAGCAPLAIGKGCLPVPGVRMFGTNASSTSVSGKSAAQQITASLPDQQACQDARGCQIGTSREFVAS